MNINDVIKMHPSKLMQCDDVVGFLNKIVNADDSPLKARYFKCLVRDNESNMARYGECDEIGMLIPVDGLRYNYRTEPYRGNRYSVGFRRG